MTLMMVAVVLLARIWESKVREEKEENADEKDETKQAAQNQLHFRFHLRVCLIMMLVIMEVMIIKNMKTIIFNNLYSKFCLGSCLRGSQYRTTL